MLPKCSLFIVPRSDHVTNLIRICQALKLVQDVHSDTPGTHSVEGDLRKIISNIIIRNAELRRQVNTVLYSSAPLKPALEAGQEASGEPVVNDESL